MGTQLTDLPRFDGLLSKLFCDGVYWPGGQTVFYQGLIPQLTDLLHTPAISHLSTLQSNRLHARLANEAHTSSILLAGRIWGQLRSSTFTRTHHPPKIIYLPHTLAHLRTSSSSRMLVKYRP